MPTIRITVNKFIYLASQSPRRRQLLAQLGVRHQLLLPDPEEDSEALERVLPNEAPLAYVKRVTQLKLEAALARLKRRGLPMAPILCSDTTVALGRTIFGKPEHAADARRMLSELSGQTHRVLTALALGTRRKREQALSESRVTFEALSAQQIQRYVASGEPIGKAGAYAIQGPAAAFISHISGSYSGIMGLPMFETAHLLRSFGKYDTLRDSPKRSGALSPTDQALRDSPKRSGALSPTELALRDSPKRSGALSPTDQALRDSPKR